MNVFFQSENGLIGTGAPLRKAWRTHFDRRGRSSGDSPAGASTFDSAMSFGSFAAGISTLRFSAACR